jgi:hypothetical protein
MFADVKDTADVTSFKKAKDFLFCSLFVLPTNCPLSEGTADRLLIKGLIDRGLEDR